MDYGHELEFGAFLTPSAAEPQKVVALAIHAEQIGLDLIAIQDHPYVAKFLDTWTLLSFIAARTERIRVMPDVINVPLRPPAVLARAASSLDLLSGGRVELGLGTGGFPDGIAAMGGGRATPGQRVDALTEAVTILRGLWDTASGKNFTFDGEHYHVRHAFRGPSPAHPIGIWLGAYKPRMLALTGSMANGWLPSMSYLGGTTGLAAGNHAIDAAATAAGRSPGEIRRALNLIGDGEASAQALTSLAIDHGVSVFIVGSDDEAMLTRFAREVAPKVRDLVAVAREAGSSTVPK